MIDHNFLKRLMRKARTEARQELIREQEVGQCGICERVYPWSYLVDFSTQEREDVRCRSCLEAEQ